MCSATNTDKTCDILIKNGKIEKVAQGIKAADAKVIDAKGLVVMPGIVDMHVSLCDPGHEERETVKTGLEAAVHGGITSVVCMPNTHPPADNRTVIENILKKADALKLANVFPTGCITKDRGSNTLSEMAELAAYGAIAFTDSPDPLDNAEVMKRAMEYCSMTGRIIINHPEDKSLSKHGVMNEGKCSSFFGLSGIPAVSEEVMVARDVLMSEMLGIPVHLCHISSARSVRIIRDAKKRKVKVSAETSPQYFTLTEENLATYDTNLKLNPPLKTENDRREIIRGLKDGTIDAISSDHTPRCDYEKEVEFDYAGTGLIGMETLFGLCYSKLVSDKHISLVELVDKLSASPSRILGLETKGSVAAGMDADFTIFDPSKDYTVDASQFKSKARNCPFDGWQLKGRVVATIVGGRVVMQEG